MPGETEMEREARQLLKRFEPEFCFPFFSGDEPFGLLLIGEKSSGTPYTPNDLSLLTRLVKNLSLILNQIRLKKQVLLTSLLERSWQKAKAQTPAPQFIPAADAPVPSRKADLALGALRDFSGILTHSLQTDALLRQFLQLLREILGVNRAAIFLRRAGDLQSPLSLPTSLGGDCQSPALLVACALGISPRLFDHFALSTKTGIGAHLQCHARILRRGTAEAAGDPDIAREFELLGAQVAIPIFDRESLLGIALFDGRLTGELFASEELSLVFHLLEELGLAIRNTWLHDALAGQHGMMTDTLDQLGSAVVVVARDLGILQANQMARGLFRRAGAIGSFTFNDLPQALGSKVFEALQTGAAASPSRCRLPGTGDASFRATLKPFQRRGAIATEAVLVLLDDMTQADRTQQMEVEAANLRLVRKMAEQLAHEIGNSLVPISTSQQLLSEGANDAATRKEISGVMGDSVRRISRLARWIAPGGEPAAGAVDSGSLRGSPRREPARFRPPPIRERWPADRAHRRARRPQARARRSPVECPPSHARRPAGRGNVFDGNPAGWRALGAD